MENQNGRGIFLGVVSVATLVVAIIGATFAFFSTQGGSADNAITANATVLSELGFEAGANNKFATNLVPVASENENFSRYPGTSASGEHSCLDNVNNEICSIYEFTVENTSDVAQSIYVSFVPASNSFDNLYFAAFKTDASNADFTVATGSSGTGSEFSLTPQTTAANATLGHAATQLTKNSTTPIDMPGLTTSLGAGDDVTYTIIVWLQETKDDQNDEQGGAFAAGVNVTTAGNSTGVTGVLSAAQVQP